MYMQQQQSLLSTQDFNMAAEMDTRNPDVYHHRGQVGGAALNSLACWFSSATDHRRCTSAPSKGSVSLPQLKILLDQVDEAVGDFDECILLRPDSALAQAQKCFALVSRGDKRGILNDDNATGADLSGDADSSVFCLALSSTDRRIPDTTRPKCRRPWTALRTSSGGSPSAQRATLFTLRC